MIIASGVRVSEPKYLMEEINRWNTPATLLHSRTLYQNEYNQNHTIISTFLDKNVMRRADYVPMHFSRLPDYFNQLPIDLAIMQVAYDKKLGFSFGTNPDYNFYFTKAKKVWVEVNKQMPWTHGPTLPISEIDRILEVDYPLPTYQHSITESEKEIFNRIGNFINKFIKNGSTVQVGVGKLQSTLKIDKEVNVYSEMIGDWVMSLKTKKIIGSFAMGSEQFYRWLDHNPHVELRSIGEITNPCAFTNIPNLVSINSAVEVDLFGQVASESVDYKQLSGTGGCNDFTAGAAISKNGVSIVAFPSVTADGKSKIVPSLANIVTIPRADIDYIITEYGVAQMKFKTVPERRKELIKIAHPRHRLWLEKQITS